MATKEEIAIAISVINEVAGSPETGIVADLVNAIKNSGNPSKEVRVVAVKETR